jgi:type I restriction enzyme S subunit
MKEGWTYNLFGEVCEVTDFVANGSFATLRQNVTYYDEPNYALLVRLADYSSGFDKRNFVYVDKHSYDFLSKSSLLGGEIIMSNVGSIGKCFICPKLADKMTIGPNSLLIKTPFNEFYLYYFKSEDFQNKLRSITSSATLSKFNKTQLKTLQIPNPSISEQKRIVARLDAAFSHIDELKANAEKQLANARALFKKALAQAMETKEGWVEKTFGDVGTFQRGINFLKSDFVEEGFPCIHYGQIHTKLGAITKKHLTCIPEELVRKDKLASSGDIIIAITSEDVEASCKCTAWLGEYDIAVGAHAAIYKHSLNPAFVSYYMKSERFQIEKVPYVHGFKVMEIKPSDIAKITIAYPSISEQQRIVERLDALSEHVRELEEIQKKIIAECDAMKHALLRKVFE